VFGNFFKSLKWVEFIHSKTAHPLFHTPRPLGKVGDMLFSCDFPLSAAAATVCVSSGFLFCFHDDDFPACDSYVCLSSTFMTIYQGKLHLHFHSHFHFHSHCSRTWSTLCFYWLHENIFHSSLFSQGVCRGFPTINLPSNVRRASSNKATLNVAAAPTK